MQRKRDGPGAEFFRPCLIMCVYFTEKSLNSHSLKARPMKSFRTSSIIHIFAVIHMIATLSCRVAGIDDSLLLTLLTMSMVLLVCFRRGVSVEFTAACIVMANIAGYLIGIGGARLMSLVSDSQLTVHAVSTIVTTEMLGWGIVALTKIFRAGGRRVSWIPRIRWLLLAIAVIFIIRLAYTEIFTSRYFTAESSYRIIRMLLSNSFAILLMICLNIIYIRFIRKHRTMMSELRKTIMFTVFVLVLSSLTALLAGYNLPFRINTTLTGNEFFLLLTISILAELCVYSSIYMIDYTVAARTSMEEEREKAHLAQFQYMKLKQQVNPHFLFNSLNILDCLVCGNRTAQASEYIHKLAGLYRYLLQNEAETVVPLEREMNFARMYADLLEVRFQDGFRLEFDIRPEDMSEGVVPCSLQMLIENAIKHNVVSRDNVLVIRVASSDGRVCVSNNINPKISDMPSTGIGLSNLRQQYLDLTGKKINVMRQDGMFKVCIPLIAGMKQ